MLYAKSIKISRQQCLPQLNFFHFYLFWCLALDIQVIFQTFSLTVLLNSILFTNPAVQKWIFYSMYFYSKQNEKIFEKICYSYDLPIFSSLVDIFGIILKFSTYANDIKDLTISKRFWLWRELVLLKLQCCFHGTVKLHDSKAWGYVYICWTRLFQYADFKNCRVNIYQSWERLKISIWEFLSIMIKSNRFFLFRNLSNFVPSFPILFKSAQKSWICSFFFIFHFN